MHQKIMKLCNWLAVRDDIKSSGKISILSKFKIGGEGVWLVIKFGKFRFKMTGGGGSAILRKFFSFRVIKGQYGLSNKIKCLQIAYNC